MDNDDYGPENYDEASVIQQDKERTRSVLSKVLDVPPDAIDDRALADLWCGPTDEAVKDRWAKKPWLQAEYINTIEPWPVASE